MKPRFFATREQLRAWFETHGSTEAELWIAYYKRGSDRTSVSYAEAVLEALCFGWIDGQVRRIDDVSYMNRYTPRGPKSTWSLANVANVRQLIDEGRMRPAGMRAFEARSASRTGVYAYERPPTAPISLDRDARSRFRENGGAWAFFREQPSGYQRGMERWITEARRPETRERRLLAVIAASAAHRRVDPLRPYRATVEPPTQRRRHASRSGDNGPPE
jgi:uncharacterized protein YdeI (YjbR/CyaY-like superfamily)